MIRSAPINFADRIPDRPTAPSPTTATVEPGLTLAALAAMQSVGDYAERPSGLLRLNMPRAIYPSYMASLMKSFRKKYPEISVELYFQDEETGMVAQGFDAGIRLSDTLARDMVVVKLFGPVRFVTSGSPRYFKQAGRPTHPRELLSHDCMRIRFGNAEIYDRWEYVEKDNDFSVHVNGTLIMNDVFMLIDAAIDGAGLIYTTEDSIADKLKSGKLETVLDSYSASSTGFYLYYPQRAQVLPKLRAFIEHIREANKGWA